MNRELDREVDPREFADVKADVKVEVEADLHDHRQPPASDDDEQIEENS